ncbi:DNA repair protein [Undibacterium oligocarboniphilum]|uniref:DNA repair protein n=1 Tax=Undibacterium oligocarboniphilum TaxID=666702 RepID=A0A850QDV6_9BURK|nr:DNA repair protein [Undibacterium oligocarboniphilum]NVO77077.1 DNA repair protein [Undibacterium oligocarboniphilum]
MSQCFVDTGDFETLIDCSKPQRILVGRTGAGKSALIANLKNSEDNVIEITPENLSLNFISNSDMLSTLEKAGVKLDIFYSLLWKHVFTVELLRYKYDLSNEENTKKWSFSFLSALNKKDQTKERALNYIRDWGDKFWYQTEYRIKEVTQKLEGELKSSLGTNIELLKSETNIGIKGSEEKKFEVISKAQSVVNSIQVKLLSDVMRLLAEEVFNDPKQKYYVVIDKLDENWVESELRYRLIRSLIETVKSFRVIPNVKIVVALRLDLLRSVFERTRDSGFQEEKYQSLLLPIHWDKRVLEDLLNKRVAKFTSEQYTKRPLTLRELFPESISRERFVDYLFNRTLYRPRDAIAFVNECLKQAYGQTKIMVQTVRLAEIEYSAQRFDYLCYEWGDHFPNLSQYLPLLEKMPNSFKLSSMSKLKIDEFCLQHCINDSENSKDPIIRAGNAYLNNNSLHAFIIVLVKALFQIGAIGIKTDSFSGQIWSFLGTRTPSDGQIKPTSEIFVHPMLWSRLGVNPK